MDLRAASPHFGPSIQALFLAMVVGFGVPMAAVAQAPEPAAAVKPGGIIRYLSRQHPVRTQEAMVVSQNQQASEVGLSIMKQGGSVVDAAIASALTLAVTLPRAGNLGGGGYMLVHEAESGQTIAINFRSSAPASANGAMFTLADQTLEYESMSAGSRAAGVPGTIAGLAQAHARWGKLDWSLLVQPAIQLAEQGIRVSHDLSSALTVTQSRLNASPAANKVFYPHGKPPSPGDLLVQTDLAGSLRALAEGGPGAFYQGSLARKLVTGIEQDGGLITESDLNNYQAVVAAALEVPYRDYQVASMPAPGSGAIVLQMLNLFACYEPEDFPSGSARQIHLWAEIFKRAYRDRVTFLEDPAFIPVPTQGLISKQYAHQRCTSIDLERASPHDHPMPADPWEFDSRDTTHLSVADGQGNAVSLTYTLGSSFGSAYMVPGTGILLNNQMRTFVRPGTSGRPAVERLRPILPGKRPVSTMSPTIVKRDGKAVLVTGSPGGHRIPIVIFQVIANALDYEMDLATATQSPRVHHNFVENVLRHEQGISPDTLSLLESMGHELRLEPSMGSTQSIMIKDGLSGAADQRRPNALAVGY